MKTKDKLEDGLVRYVEGGAKQEKKQVIIDAALETMLKRHKTITVDLVLKEAQSDGHPLHSLFEWDDGVAADKFRKMQAYAMILSSRFTVQLVRQDNSHTKVLKSCRVRRLVNAFNGEGFKLRTDALKSSSDRAAIIEKKKAVLRSWCQSVVDIDELRPLRETIESSLE